VKKDEKLTLRLPEKLKQDMLDYAERHGTSVTQITLVYWRALLAAEGRQEAEQA
jgi:hypothetical protein